MGSCRRESDSHYTCPTLYGKDSCSPRKGQTNKGKKCAKNMKKIHIKSRLFWIMHQTTYLCALSKRDASLGGTFFQFLEQSEKVQIAHILVNWKFQH